MKGMEKYIPVTIDCCLTNNVTTRRYLYIVKDIIV